MLETEQQFRAISPEGKPEKKIKEPEKTAEKPSREELNTEPIKETPDSVYYLGVRLPKSKDSSGEFVPQREKYQDYINDKFSLELQKKIAISFFQGDPILVEGGTSIGKTTTTRKMCSDLGWEVHYCNLNGATDVEDLMGRYIPNPYKIDRNKISDEQFHDLVSAWTEHTRGMDPEILTSQEFIFADGKITSGLRQEKGKTKVIILDELNAAAPNILIRLHEVLDALERGESVILSEDASEAIIANKEVTKIIGLMNPPGKGYFAREPLDPAQLRRWVYQKEVTDLPLETFSHATDALFSLITGSEKLLKGSFLVSPEQVLSKEQLAEIPGISEITAKYKEFHQAAKEMLKTRTLAADQPQPFTYDDRMEPRRVRDFVLKFYNGDINETFQQALRYYYTNKLESEADKEKLEELISHVTYVPASETKRRTLETRVPQPENLLQDKVEKELAGLMADSKIPEAVKAALRGKETTLSPDILKQLETAKKIFGQDFLGPEAVETVFDVELDSTEIPAIPFSRQELESAQKLGQFLILRSDKIPEGKFELPNTKRTLEKAPTTRWALVSKEIIPDSTSKNYLEQTEQLIDYVKNKVFAGKTLPKKYQEAIAEFAKEKVGIAKIIISSKESEWKKAAEKLANLKITQLTRQTRDETLYDIETYYQTNKEYLLPDKWSWTSSRSSDGRLVLVGDFDAHGVRVSGWRPGLSDDDLGVSFSRSL
ncbi:MAG: AAA family ATPase [Patescibacteria group bacterium]|nr:AAA family ATPase [Patescibacteria group bacterium]